MDKEFNLVIASELIEALKQFDQMTKPFGLYACEESLMKDRPEWNRAFLRLHQEWHLCLKPCLERLGCQVGSIHRNSDDIRFSLPDDTSAILTIIRTSKIKVRKYGSNYRIDLQQKYAERWQELRLDRRLSDLWKPSSEELGERFRIVLFIGFAREAEPFSKELSRLSDQLKWGEHQVNYVTDSWEDRFERRFFVRTSAWSRISEPR